MDAEALVIVAVGLMFVMNQSKAAPVNPYQSMMGPMPQSQQPLILNMGGTQPQAYGGAGINGGFVNPSTYGRVTQLPYGSTQSPYGYGIPMTDTQMRKTQQAGVVNNLINKAPDIINSISKMMGGPADATVEGAAAKYDGSLLNDFAGSGSTSFGTDLSSDAFSDTAVQSIVDGGAEEVAGSAALDATGMSIGLPPGSITAAVHFAPQIADAASNVIEDTGNFFSDAFDW